MLTMKILYTLALISSIGQKVLCLPVNTSCSDALPMPTSFNLRIVLVIDVSASMDIQDRLINVQSVLSDWILNLVPCKTMLAMVQFSSSSKTLSGLKKVTDKNRIELNGTIPIIAQGETCVSCGLERARKILASRNMTNGHSVIFLITDAKESELDLNDTFLLTVKASGIQVVAAVLSDKGQVLKDIEEITKETNGSSYYIKDGNVTQGLMEALISVQNFANDNLPEDHFKTTDSTRTTPYNDSASLEPEEKMENSTVSSDSTEHPETTKEIKTSVSVLSEITTSSISNISNTIETTSSSVVESTSNNIGSNVTTEGEPKVNKFFNSPIMYIGAGAILAAVAIIVIICMSYKCCRKPRERPFPSKGSYQLPTSTNSGRVYMQVDHVRNRNLADDDRYG